MKAQFLRYRRVVLVVVLLIAFVAAFHPVQPSQAQVTSTWTYLHTSGKNILDANGNIVHISGVSWFGGETADCAPDGLWSRNYKDMLNQIKSLGYNTIRLPYSTDFMDYKDTGGGCNPQISLYFNPDLADPADPTGQTPLKGWPLMDKIINYAGSIGLRIFLDRHRAENSTQSALWYDPGSTKYTEARWISDWQWLANHFLGNPTIIGADLHNEPHSIQGQPSISACWGCGNTATDWKLAAERAGNAILAINPNWLIIVEGTDTNPTTGATTWWGGDLSNAGNDPVVLNSPGHVVYSPHEYPASIFAQTWFSDPTYPANLPSVWESHWGYLDTNNIAPVLIGEFGTKLATTSDQQWFNSLTVGSSNNGYIKSKSLNWTFWSFNPNSGDTGGVLSDDWTTVVQAKQTVLAQIEYPFIGVPPAGTPAATATAGTGATNTPSFTPTFMPPTATTVGTVAPTATKTNTPAATATTGSSATPVPPTATVGSSGSGLVVMINRGNNLDNNQETAFNFAVKNSGSSAVSNVSTRIYFTTENGNAGTAYMMEKYYDQSGVASFGTPTLACGNTYYIPVTYGTASLAAGAQWEIQTALHLSSWGSTFDGSNDWYHTGYAVGAFPVNYANTNNIPAYVNGTLSWGSTPTCSGVTNTPVPPTATTGPTKTNTPVPTTAVPPTATNGPTKTNTPVPPTATTGPTKTSTPVPTNTVGPSATPNSSDPCASATVISGSGSYSVTTATTCFKYVNTSFKFGALASVMNGSTSASNTVKWYGATSETGTSCSNQSSTLNGNGAQLSNFVISKDSNGQMYLIITGSAANTVSINLQNWQNGSGCSVPPTVHP